jgi:peptide/nickel transport system permease protein
MSTVTIAPSGAGAASNPLFGAVRKVTRSPSLRVISRRVLAAIPVLWGVTFFTFIMMNLLPGDAAVALLGANATPQQVHALEIRLHLNEPFFVRYWHWFSGVLTGNFGTSVTSGQNVTTILAQRLPVTFELVLYAFIISIVFTVPVALLSARKPGGIVDRISIFISMAGFSIPGFVLALLLILVFAVKLGVLPAIGFVPISQSLGANLRSLTLPAVSIGFGLFCGNTRFLRADIIEQSLSMDYVLTAKAKGAGPWRVLVRHVLRNSLLGIITLVGLQMGTLIGGTVIIEQIFSLPGIGQGLLVAINDRDVVLVEAVVLVFAACVVLANLITDLLYTVIDPRIRYGSASN